MSAEESIIPQTNTEGCYVSEKTNIAQNSFWEGILGKEVNIHIQEQGEDVFKVLQVDQYFIIVEHEQDGFILLNKSAIISVTPFDSATPDLIQALANGVRKIQYKPSEKRTNHNRKRLNNNYTKPTSESVETPKKEVQVIVKPKRHILPDGQRD